MSLTSDMKDELARVPLQRLSEKQAEIAAMLRFASGLNIVARRIVVAAEVDTELTATRLRLLLSQLFHAESQVIIVSGGGLRKGERYVVRVVEEADNIAKSTGLIDRYGRPVRGLPPAIVSGGKNEARAAWRGAFLARGSLTEPGRSSSLEVTCPGPEAALALVGAARRLGVTAKSREIRSTDRVVIRDGDMIEKMVRELGAPKTCKIWHELRERRELRGCVNRLANFDDANLRRSARAAVVSAARVRKAFEILGEDIPEHLYEAGQLRITYRDASLEELGRQAQPPLTKDAVAGRIRRLLAMADNYAMEHGMEDTRSALTPEMMND
ncbi:MAG: DNA-binding protein WhiA [Actinomycetaceae bacterium]|nr:DNA-binding protein WhiA [Actinomycetaceae bacterium]